MRKKKATGEFVLDAQYRVPNTESDLKKTTIEVWEEQKILILDFKIPMPIEQGRKLSILITKKELGNLWKVVKQR